MPAHLRPNDTITCASGWSEAVLARLERAILPAYLPTCRWFGGKGRALRELKIAQNVAIGALTEARLLVIAVTFTDGSPESYVLPLIFIDEPSAVTLQTILARFADGRVLCDAIYVAEVRAEFLRLIARGTEDHAPAPLAGSGASERLEAAVLARALAQSRVAGADQSNTSVIYGDVWFLKLFRKFEHGPNPDVEVTQFLSEVCGFRHVPPYLGALRLTDPTGAGVIALLAGFTPNQGDGWTFTLEALARYFERVLASRAEPTALFEMIGADYPERARQLGQRTAEMHLALASGEGRPEFAAEPFSTQDQQSLYDAMCDSASRVLRELRDQAVRLPAASRADATEIAAQENHIVACFARLLSRPIAAARIRTHGDYHLGQVLNTGTDFVILDFEGEPRLALAERLLKRSPLRDVAGMLRSFDYAGAAALRLQNPADIAHLEPWARGWVEAVCAQFLDAYFATAGGASFLPPDPADVTLLLEVFTLDKALYEIGYELSYRPDFLAIPTGAVRRLLAETQ